MADGSNFATLNAARPTTWTDERTELARRLWSDGYSASQIAKRLGGVTRNSVIGKAFRMGWKHEAPSKPLAKPFLWNDALDARLRAAVEAGDTDAEIAEAFGTVRGVINYRRHRLGLLTNHTRKAPKKPTAVFNTHPKADVSHGIERAPVIPKEAAFAGIGKRTTLAIALFGECRWPLECVEDEQTLCGETTLLEQVYCACHAKLARNPIQPKGGERDLARALRRYA